MCRAPLTRLVSCALLMAAFACTSEAMDDSQSGGDGNVDAASDTDAVSDSGATTGPDASPEPDGTPGGAATAADWILDHFEGQPVLTGGFDSRTQVEAPSLVLDATGTGAKYAFETVDESAPNVLEVGFVDVSITALVSSDAFGAGIVTNDPGMVLFLANVSVEPDWPLWESYDTTNKDGIVLDGATAVYAEDLTIRNFNADSAIDNKAQTSQLVRLIIEGPGNRSIRYWREGPHYLVDSSIENPGTAGSGVLLWFKDCSLARLYVYNSTFNGASTVAAGDIDCDTGSAPQIIYLTTDPRTTGEMHPMF